MKFLWWTETQKCLFNGVTMQKMYFTPRGGRNEIDIEKSIAGIERVNANVEK